MILQGVVERYLNELVNIRLVSKVQIELNSPCDNVCYTLVLVTVNNELSIKSHGKQSNYYHQLFLNKLDWILHLRYW